MAVNEALSAYSTTAASNTPAGTDTVGPDLDDHLRDIKKNVASAARHQSGDATPEDALGFIHYEVSGSPTNTLNVWDQAWIKMLQVDSSAAATFPYIGTSVMGAVMRGLNQDTTASARTLLDLGTSATLNTGTSANDTIILLSGSATTVAALPVLSGENLTTTLEEVVVALGTETDAVAATASAVVSFRMPYAMELHAGNKGVRLSATTAPSATATVDVDVGGTSILGNRLTIDPSEKTSLSAATAVTVTAGSTLIADDALVEVHIDHPGGGTATGLKLALRGYRSV